MSVTEFLSGLESSAKVVLSAIHNIIIAEDKCVDAAVGKMMGKEMILYTSKGIFKYGLASAKNHMSLHLLPIYVSPELHQKYSTLLKNANFQKGCINFKTQEEMPLIITRRLIADAAKLDMAAIMNKYKSSKKAIK